MNETMNLGYISVLVNYYNLLAVRHDIPQGYLQVNLDDCYTGEVYAIEFEYLNGEFTLGNGSSGLIFSVIYSDGTTVSGSVNDYEPEEIAHYIKRTVKMHP